MTEWRDTKHKNYQVSDQGEVRKVILPGVYKPIKSNPVQFPNHKKEYVNRLVYEAFIGPIPEHKFVLGGPSVDTLRLGKDKPEPTRISNTDAILRLSNEGMKNSDIARQLGITQGAVTHCLKRNKKADTD